MTEQEQVWLAARLRGLRLDAERFEDAANQYGVPQVGDQLRQVSREVSTAEELLEDLKVNRGSMSTDGDRRSTTREDQP